MKKADLLLNKLAREKFDIHTITKEWKIAIFAAIILKFLTNVISIFAAYQLVYNYAYTLIEKEIISIISSVTFLVLIEIITLYSLEKGFKFALHKRLKVSIISLVFAGAFFTLSYQLSTKGLELRQSKQVDNTKLIVDETKLEVDNISIKYDNEVKRVKDEIALIKANTWRGRLSTRQMNLIKQYNNDISTLQSNCKSEINGINEGKQMKLSQNAIGMNREGKKYYFVAMVLLIIQFVLNFVLMLFWSLIRNEKNPKAQIHEQVKELKTELTKDMFSLVGGEVKMLIGEIRNNMALELAEYTEISSAPLQKKNIGFRSQTDSTGTPVKTPVDKTPVNATKKNYGSTVCPNCSTTFEKLTYNHKWCSELCRLEYYEKKTGKRIDNLKDKHNGIVR